MSEDVRPMFGTAIGPWHEWFAWRPVETHDFGWVWMRWVWRQRYMKNSHLDGPDFRWWFYRRDRR